MHAPFQVIGSVETNCNWFRDVNEYDKKLEFSCPSNQVITGIESTHNNYREDRRLVTTFPPTYTQVMNTLAHTYFYYYSWSVKCCGYTNVYTQNDNLSEEVNEYDQKIDFYARDGYAFSGLESYHSNHHE